MAPFLNLNAVTGRPARLQELVAGIGANPMNQAHLSQLPVRTLALLLEQGDKYAPPAAWQQALAELVPAELAQLLVRDAQPFSERGIGFFGTSEEVIAGWERRVLEAPGFTLLPTAAQELLRQDRTSFRQRADQAFSPQERAQLVAQYAQVDHPMAREVVGWLQGQWRFDPAIFAHLDHSGEELTS